MYVEPLSFLFVITLQLLHEIRRSGVCDVRHLLNRGVRLPWEQMWRWYTSFILDAIRLTLCASVAACQMNEESVRIKWNVADKIWKERNRSRHQRNVWVRFERRIREGAKDPRNL